MTVFVAVFGKKKRGKTKTIERLVKELRAMNVRVGVAKHVHHADFTIDKPGKDSWRYAEAGAERVLIVSPSEIADIKKIRAGQGHEDILKRFSGSSIDVVLMEGFYESFSRDTRVAKLIVGVSDDDVSDILANCSGRVIGCVATEENHSISPEGKPRLFLLPTDAKKIAEIILSLGEETDDASHSHR